MIDLNNYQKVQKIDEGSFGKVYKIKEKNTGEIFAAKLIYRQSFESSSGILNIEREVNNHFKLSHPSIVKFVGYSQTDFNNQPNPVIVMEYLKNNSLFYTLGKERLGDAPHDWDEKQKLINIYGIASAMQFLHSNNVIHRDLKTLNILKDENYLPRVADFGFSKIIHSNADSLSLQSTNGLKGTCQYIAPEIFRDNDYSKKSDVYAFGIIVYEIITNEIPFKNFGLSQFEIMQKVPNGERPKFLYEIPECYKSLIEECWKDDPNERPTFDEIVENLENNRDFLYDDDDYEIYLQYIEDIKNSEKSFREGNQVINIEKYLALRKMKSLKKVELTKKNSFSNFFSLFKKEYKSKIICPVQIFDRLDKSNQDLVTQALTDPETQLTVGKYLIEGKESFPRNIEIGLKYLKESIACGCLKSVLYYSNMLIKGDIIPQDIESAKRLLFKHLKEDDSMVHFLYGLVLKKQKYYADSMKYFAKASKEGNINSKYEYAKMLFCQKSGIFGTNQENIEKAIYYLNDSSSHGNKNSEKFLKVYYKLNEVDGFNRLPAETQKFLIMQICKSNETEKKCNLKTNVLQMLLMNHSLDSPVFIDILKTFNSINITLDYTYKNYAAIHNKIETIKQLIPEIYYYLKISGIKMIENVMGPDSFVNEITIDSSVNSIIDGAFCEFSKLQKVTIASSITTIPTDAFQSCSSLTEILIPLSVTLIGKCAFMECTSLSNIIIPSSVKCIEFSAFEKCTSLRRISIPSSINKIKYGTFKECTSLTEIIILPSVKSIEYCTFEKCTSLRSISIPISITIIEYGIFKDCTLLTHIRIPVTVKSIENCAFENCTSLTEIIIPSSVISIANSAFKGCISLAHVIIHSTNCKIGQFSFADCNSLTRITGNENIMRELTEIGVRFEIGDGMPVNYQEALRYY